MRDDSDRLRDILKATGQIFAKTRAGSDAFYSDEMLQIWVLHHLQVIGEAARCLSEEFKRRHEDKVWARAAGMRHIIVHHYFEIDPDQMWRVVEHDLVPLQQKILEILGDENPVVRGRA